MSPSDVIVTTAGLPAGAAPLMPRDGVIVDGKVAIPPRLDNLEAFRRWAHSDAYPESGWISFLNGAVWVDTTMEEWLTHNQVKEAYSVAIGICLLQNPIGRKGGDRMLLTNVSANLSTEPDGLFFLWETMRSGRIRMVPGKRQGYMELEGTPDMILEIISQTSLRKDKEVLRELYWKAGITEYWLVDASPDPPQFDILRHTEQGYVRSPAVDSWQVSAVLGKQFRLARMLDPLGHPQFVVEVR